jgi:uncharacterized protein YkwD
VSPAEFGMMMASRAYEAVCWYEYIKIFPKTQNKKYNKCSGQSIQVKKQVKGDESQQPKTFGSFMGMLDTMSKIPSEYAACNDELASASSETTLNEGETIGDQGQTGYPLRAFTYCMMKTLRDKNGKEATDAVKEEKSGQRKHWTTVISERDNQYRARHGVPALQMTQNLMDAAQRWADENAQACDSHHSGSDRDGEDGYNGESIYAASEVDKSPDNTEDIALRASNSWYEEIDNYPFPGGVDNSDGGRGTIGHFTQSVWKATKYVGYGYAYNPSCPSNKHYIVARYNPGGNMGGEFRDNVMPPQN